MKVLLALSSLLLIVACTPASQSGPNNPTAPAAAGSFSTADLTTALRSAGITVEAAGDVEQPFFTRRARVFRANGENLQVYEFASADAAARAAADVAPGGDSIGTTTMTWMAPPHFYRKNRVIALHLGTSSDVTRALRDVMGAQFAGR